MYSQTLHIKHMVCQRCIMVVEQCFQQLGIELAGVQLGEVYLTKAISEADRKALEEALTPLGFELIDDKKSRLVNAIKTTIIELVHRHDNQSMLNLSNIISQHVGQDYQSLSQLFSEVERTTIEKYYIAQKIERVKELLEYDELRLSEIAYQLQYSSVAYLSNQFKKVTGMTPTQFKNSHNKLRLPLDKV